MLGVNNLQIVLAYMLVSIMLALLLPDNITALATAMFIGLCVATFLPSFAYGVFSKNPRKRWQLW